jgi:hypothetical protein
LDITDRATGDAVGDAVAVARVIADNAGISSPVSDEAGRIHECFKAGIPAHGLINLADVINAEWREYIGGISVYPRAGRAERFSRLADVILKTIEVMEFEIRAGKP